MPTVFSSLRDRIPQLVGYEATATEFHHNGRRSYRDTSRILTDTFITPMEKSYESLGAAHRDSRIEGTAITLLDETPHSEDLRDQIHRTIACKGGYPATFKPNLQLLTSFQLQSLNHNSASTKPRMITFHNRSVTSLFWVQVLL